MRALQIIALIAATLALPAVIMAGLAGRHDAYPAAYGFMSMAFVLSGISGACQTIRNMRANKSGQRTAKTTRKSPEPIGHIECYCGDKMPIYGDVEITGEPGAQIATVSVDTSALWLHSFQKHPDAH
ncbi:hypothetical protein ART_1601 [Arthrobacter sp. PAMC 25486]|uniref:hypothetical protein n=1 Tax=Arthrobacter sp. PAMC 25486 TaxID=1494608 RepID=UPI00053640D5|nr:hypothetical protein [Arthrobacter sp. PAMC 25486]AIY01200.1 hypothetical protein ART_1601 [Arthrobacter sp. PAMC 25486]